MKKNIALFCVLFFSMPFIHGMNDSRSFTDKFLAQLNKCDEFIDNVTMPYLNPRFHEDANGEYQKLGKQAQDQLHISSLDQVPIKHMKNLSDENAGAMATSAAIFVDEDYLNNFPLAVKRYLLLHEAAHVKHRDSLQTKLVFVGYAIFNGTIYLLSDELSTPIVALCGAVTGSILLGVPYLSSLHESHADKAAINALDCYKCADEVKKIICTYRAASSFSKGYWDGEQIQTVIDKFKQQNKLCPDHEKQMADSGNVFQKIRTWVSGR